MKYYFLFFALLSVACSGSGSVEFAPKATEIKCTVAYRQAVTQPIEREEIISFSDADAEQEVVFDDVAFHAAYASGAIE